MSFSLIAFARRQKAKDISGYLYGGNETKLSQESIKTRTKMMLIDF